MLVILHFLTTKNVGKGPGQGVASVHGIFRNHGELIDVYSEKGVGITFNLCLPASDKEIFEDEMTDGDLH